MNLTPWIGLAAACLTTASFLPQAWLVLKTGETSGISLTMYGMFVSGVALWLGYGLLIAAWPVVFANLVTLVLASTVLALKLRAVLAERRAVRSSGPIEQRG